MKQSYILSQYYILDDTTGGLGFDPTQDMDDGGGDSRHGFRSLSFHLSTLSAHGIDTS
jgi:hypothetical protein